MLRFWTAAFLVVGLSGCAGLLDVDNSSAISVTVQDQNGIGVEGVTATLEMTTSAGATETVTVVTRADGAAQFSGLLPGIYPVSIVPPAGYVAGSTGLSSEVLLNNGTTVSVYFLLARTG